MSADFTALARAVVAGLPEVSACVALSRDGLALASHPADAESRAVELWARLAGLGNVERGFVVLEGELWAFVNHGGRVVAVARAEASGRAGAILVELDQALRAAEPPKSRRPSRSTRNGAEVPRRRRISLHPGRERAPRATRIASPTPVEAPPQTGAAAGVDSLELSREFGGLLSDGRESDGAP
jgi:hypothetical protein